jgi:hypothetical protein
MSEKSSTNGAWIFVSHSTKDIKEVRAIRNELERLGHHPLLFFLKCINDHDELDELLKREIEARSFFLLCDSSNSRASRWVQQEVSIISSRRDKTYELIDLNSDWHVQVARMQRLSCKATVFLSYDRENTPEVRNIGSGLAALDYNISFDEGILAAGDDLWERIQRGIDEALHHGFFLYFVSPASLKRQTLWQSHELLYALRRSQEFAPGVPCVVPVVLGDSGPELSPLPADLARHFFIDLRMIPPIRHADEIHARLSSVTRQWNDG